MKKQPQKRARNWFLTIPAGSGDKAVSRPDLVEALDKYEAYAGQLERGAGGYMHWQIVVHHSNSINFQTLKNKLPTAHIEPVESLEASYHYCTKISSRVPGHAPLIKGDWSKYAKVRQGKRSDLDKLYERILQGMEAVDEILLSSPVAFKHPQLVERLVEARDRAVVPPWRDVQVSVLWGASGTGKTRTALSAFPGRTCRVTHYHRGCFDGLRASDAVLVLDEFTGADSIRLGELLPIIDGHPVSLSARYSDRVAGFSEVFICSNVPPWYWYPYENSEVLTALCRRIDTVTEYKSSGETVNWDMEEVRCRITEGAFGPM